MTSHNSRPARLRVALLGAVAIAAVSGAVVDRVVPFASPARAEAPAVLAQGGPASFADVVDQVKGSVVSVKVEMRETAAAAPGDDDQGSSDDSMERFFRRFGGRNSPFGQGRQGQKQEALGSGFIISSDGFVVTNNHVVENATDVTIIMDDGKSMSATVVGTDKKTDLALLKIKGGGSYPHVTFADHSPRVGDWVLAVGNPFGLGGTVTAGIVSARGRDIGSGPYDDFLQIDAPVNRGNSGGPTFNNAGQVVGVNTAIFSPSGGSVGIGFAIPTEVVKTVVAALKDKGSVARGYIGVQIQPVTQDIADSLGLASTRGALVADAQKNSPAAAAGLKSGDVITAVNGDTIDSARDLSRRIAALGPDKKADLTFSRDGASKTVSVTLGALPIDKEARASDPAPDELNAPTAMAGLGLGLAPAASVRGAGRDGVVITQVDADSAAAQKGLRVGDVILEANGKTITRPADLAGVLDAARKDRRKAVLLRVQSGGASRFVAIETKAG